MSKKIIIIGATSGIGRAMAIEMHKRGHIVGATGRRSQRLTELKQNLGDRLFIQSMDITNTGHTLNQLERLISEMNGIDTIVLNAGVSSFQEKSGRESDLSVVDVNITGFVNLAAFSFELFEEQGHGHIVGVSSIASLFPWGLSAPYNASKAFVNTYLQGYQQKANHSTAAITVTNLMPGFVESEMTENKSGMFWVASTPKAARQMVDAIEGQKERAYITRRWRLIAWLIKLTPQWVWNHM